MWIHRDGPAVRVRTPAKVNLFLEVLGRRPDGYHDLATLMVTVGLCDTLEFRAGGSDGVRLECDQPGLSTVEAVGRINHLLAGRCVNKPLRL